MPQQQPVDQGITWQFPHLDDLRFMRAVYVQHAFKPHAHDYFVLGIIEDGVQSFTHERERFITTPGKLIIINPGEIHTGEAAIKDGFVYRSLYPTADLMKRIAGEFKVKSNDLPHFPGGTVQDDRLFRWMRHLHHLSEYPASSLEIEERLTAFLVELINRYAVRQLILPEYQSAHQAVLQVRDYLEAHYDQNVTLSDLANLVYITPYHLARLFSQQIGIPPHKYLENVRIRHAERLLQAGISIADVAYATGFSSQSHLTRTFKRFIGTTPGEFLQQRKIV